MIFHNMISAIQKNPNHISQVRDYLLYWNKQKHCFCWTSILQTLKPSSYTRYYKPTMYDIGTTVSLECLPIRSKNMWSSINVFFVMHMRSVYITMGQLIWLCLISSLNRLKLFGIWSWYMHLIFVMLRSLIPWPNIKLKQMIW